MNFALRITQTHCRMDNGLRYPQRFMEEEEYDPSWPFGRPYSIAAGQYYALVGVCFTSSFLSALGSCLLFYLCKRKANRTLYHRLLMALSLSDVGLSISLVVQYFAAARQDGIGAERPLALGTQETCYAAAVPFAFFAFASPMYSCALALYFYGTACRGWTDRQLTNRVERPVHILVATVCTSVPIVAYIQREMGIMRTAMICMVGSGMPFNLVPAVLIIVPLIVSVVGTAAVYRNMWQQVRRSRRYEFAPQDQQTSSNANSSMLREAGIQSLLFCAAFVNSIVWTLIATALVLSTERYELEVGYFGTKLCMLLFYPLQGFFNCFIYLRPLVSKWRVLLPTWRSAFAMALRTGEGPSPMARRNHRRASMEINTLNSPPVITNIGSDEIPNGASKVDLKNKPSSTRTWLGASSDLSSSPSSLRRGPMMTQSFDEHEQRR